MKILIVEDDFVLAEEILLLCKRWGFEGEYLESGLVYDRGQGILFYENQPIEITKSESRIMSILADYKGQVVDRETLMQGLWNTDEYVTDASLTVLISRLRSKICAATEGISCIHTRKGKGYYLE